MEWFIIFYIVSIFVSRYLNVILYRHRDYFLQPIIWFVPFFNIVVSLFTFVLEYCIFPLFDKIENSRFMNWFLDR